jgi:hypothetical protein
MHGEASPPSRVEYTVLELFDLMIYCSPFLGLLINCCVRPEAPNTRIQDALLVLGLLHPR